MVDDEDFEWLSQWKWFAHRNSTAASQYYAWRNQRRADGSKTIVQMHVAILNPDSGFSCDHRDGDGLNNQRANLRTATHQQNMRNRRKTAPASSRYVGVDWYQPRGTWRARVGSKTVGYFKSEAEAHAARVVAARLAYGEFAPEAT